MKIYFADFWENFPQTDNYFYHLLRTRYEVEIDSVDPDIVFFSIFGQDHKAYKNHRSKKVFYTGENVRPLTSESVIYLFLLMQQVEKIFICLYGYYF